LNKGIKDQSALTSFSGVVWRIMFENMADNPQALANAPEGRFHHDAQAAIYTSLTPEGAGVAIRRYLSANDPPRVIIPLEVKELRMLDLRNPSDTATPVPTSVKWQDERARGLRASTWDISDNARKLGAQGILYSSRSRPELSHLVLFGVPVPGGLLQAGSIRQWRSVDND